MKTVFLVSSGSQMDGDYQIHGVFSTIGIALKVMDQLKEKGLTAWVQEYEIDKLFE